jgi:hypothetical protein
MPVSTASHLFIILVIVGTERSLLVVGRKWPTDDVLIWQLTIVCWARTLGGRSDDATL